MHFICIHACMRTRSKTVWVACRASADKSCMAQIRSNLTSIKYDESN